jgi:hypothetical protein
MPLNETYQDTGYIYIITAVVPQLSDSHDPDAPCVLTDCDDPRVQAFNQRLNEIVESEVDTYRQEFLNLPVPMPSTFESSLEVTYELVSQIADIWSLKLDLRFYLAGAAHPGHENVTVNYDLGQGKELALVNLFLPNSNYLEMIAKYCIAELSKQLGDFFDAFGAQPTAENYDDWNITPDGLLITFDTGQVSAYAAGPQTVVVPYHELQAAIDPQGPLGKILR